MKFTRLPCVMYVFTFLDKIYRFVKNNSDYNAETATMKRFAPVAVAEASCVRGETKSSSESELVLLTSSTTSLFGSICRKLRHWNVRWPAAT